ncbi:MAG: hypothetical protein ABIO73_10675 [Polaromonas sp.]
MDSAFLGSFSRWGKAGMGASGGKMPAAQPFQPAEEFFFLHEFAGAKLNSQSPYPSLPPEGEGANGLSTLPRSAAQGTQTAGSPFLCLLSFGEAKDK